jgi:hypothetical protein
MGRNPDLMNHAEMLFRGYIGPTADEHYGARSFLPERACVAFRLSWDKRVEPSPPTAAHQQPTSKCRPFSATQSAIRENQIKILRSLHSYFVLALPPSAWPLADRQTDSTNAYGVGGLLGNGCATSRNEIRRFRVAYPRTQKSLTKLMFVYLTRGTFSTQVHIFSFWSLHVNTKKVYFQIITDLCRYIE